MCLSYLFLLILFITGIVILYMTSRPQRTKFKATQVLDAESRPFPFEVDAVVTWVDHTDPLWIEAKTRYLQTKNPHQLPEGLQTFRFENVGELYYCLKGIQTYLPWIRRVYLVTMRPQRPPYLEEFPKTKVVHHDEIFESQDSLPSFNSNAIETSLYRIKGLAEHFIYFNDDFFIGKPLSKNFFFSVEGHPKIYRRNYVNIYQQANHSMLRAHKITDFVPVSPAHQATPVKKTNLKKIWDFFPEPLLRTQKSRFREKDNIWIVGLVFQLCTMGWFGSSSCIPTPMKSPNQLLLFLGTTSSEKVRKKMNDYAEGKLNPSLICINDIKINVKFHKQIWSEFKTIYKKNLKKKARFMPRGKGFRKSVKKTKRNTFVKSWDEPHRERYVREKIAYQQLNSTGIVPRLINYNDKNLELEIENGGVPLRYLKRLDKLTEIEKKSPDWRDKIGHIIRVLHNNNIGHGDWSGANLLYYNGEFKVIDFDKGHAPSEKYFENVRLPVLPKKGESLTQYLSSIEGLDKFIPSSTANKIELELTK